MTARITILGSYAKALVVTADRIPVSGETLLGWDYRETFGGKGSDMAVQAARLGADVRFLGVVGNDHLGREFLDLMKQEEVDSSRVRVTDQSNTGVGLIIKDTQGSNIIVVDMGANRLFDTGDVDAARAQLTEADVVLAQLEIPLETALHGLKLARNAGVRTILNPAPAALLTETDLSAVDILTPNETEARVLLGLDPQDPASNREIADRILNLGCGQVVMTLGEKGAASYARVAGDTIETVTPAWPINVIDSNGAGDSFNAALATALGEGSELDAAVDFAAATAGLCCTKWETVPSYHTREEIDSFISRTLKE